MFRGAARPARYLRPVVRVPFGRPGLGLAGLEWDALVRKEQKPVVGLRKNLQFFVRIVRSEPVAMVAYNSDCQNEIPQERLTVDKVNVKEGELALSYKGGEGGTLNEGVLTIQPADEDNANKYRVENENLVYDE